METLANIIRHRIRKARLEANLTQKELSSKIGMNSHATIARYESGTLGISAELLYSIAQATNKPISYFYGEPQVTDKDIGAVYAQLNATGRRRLNEYIGELIQLYSK